ncbi:Hypothetical predicted protein [Cloeon dipterum]|uniref:Uncharacterized protein n=1 Tax=Cloeon dipterum TaxID=197152 RepID=A0A8S1DF80_9INSE|nr:Hypothetical predicted protein [Cloeon dipterum]
MVGPFPPSYPPEPLPNLNNPFIKILNGMKNQQLSRTREKAIRRFQRKQQSPKFEEEKSAGSARSQI